MKLGKCLVCWFTIFIISLCESDMKENMREWYEGKHISFKFMDVVEVSYWLGQVEK